VRWFGERRAGQRPLAQQWKDRKVTVSITYTRTARQRLVTAAAAEGGDVHPGGGCPLARQRTGLVGVEPQAAARPTASGTLRQR
jgi:hypothetical protein